MRTYHKIFIFLVFILTNANADCFEEAGKEYKINPLVLKAIAKVESSLNPYAINKNKNSFDIGIMQINSFWIKKLLQYGYSIESLYKPCVNIKVGAWILAQCINKFGYSWKAVDCYNKGSARAKENSLYVKKVKKELIKLNWKIYQSF